MSSHDGAGAFSRAILKKVKYISLWLSIRNFYLSSVNTKLKLSKGFLEIDKGLFLEPKEIGF